ncbi:lipopolysaccharide biosynthesis protein [Aliarcobacter butzleri]|uniref:lipopolysaccharide biosynthesis protein n=1 Tax=Aliarcobacter butzleri TaxID=28197 RepID=UPI0012FA5ADA|nr:lipopolysaccharide biosynthesis protein [Aliarcobacter butzleri]
MQELQGKTVLLLAPKFFGYEIEIKKELENLGARVIYFDERPKNDFFTKVFIRLNLKKLIKNDIEKYFRNIINFTKDKSIDFLFLVSPETIDVEKIEKLRNIHKNLKVYTYMWDSIENKKNAFPLIHISDRFFTFDSNDKMIDNKIKFLALFYINDYRNIATKRNELIYDISFIGTVHSDRYTIIKKIEEQAKEFNLKTYFYFYSPSKILFFFQKLFKKDFQIIKWNDVSFKSLSKLDVLNVIGKSKSIIDIQHPLQTGLTMRTIEIIGAKKKLFTTNKDVENYDFYNNNNILIINRNEPKLDIDFFKKDYEEIDEAIYEKYCLNSWLKTIFKDDSE